MIKAMELASIQGHLHLFVIYYPVTELERTEILAKDNRVNSFEVMKKCWFSHDF